MWNSFIKYINYLTERITMFFLSSMVVLVFIQVILRNIFSIGINWIEEAAIFLSIWTIYLGLGFAYQSGAHVSIDLLVSIVPKRWKKLLFLLMLISCLVFIIILAIYGTKLCNKMMMRTSMTIGMPMGLAYSVIPISCVLQILNLTDISWKFFKKEVE